MVKVREAEEEAGLEGLRSLMGSQATELDRQPTNEGEMAEGTEDLGQGVLNIFFVLKFKTNINSSFFSFVLNLFNQKTENKSKQIGI